MANVIIDDAHLGNIAAAIREKNGSTVVYKPRDMAAAIANLEVSSGGESGGGTVIDPTDYSTYTKTNVTQLEYTATTIPDRAFVDFTSLRRFRSTATEVGMEVFRNCSNLNYVVLRNAVNVGRFEETTLYPPFYGCRIQTIDFGENIENINLYGTVTNTLEKVVIRKVRRNDDNTFTLPTLKMSYIPQDQRSGLYLYVPAAVKQYYETEQAAFPSGNYAFFKLREIEGSEFETPGGDLR